MKATNIGKTIIVWNKLSDSEIIEIINVLKEIIGNYRKYESQNLFNRPIPIALEEPNNYLCIIKKHHEIFICATRIVGKNKECFF